MAASTQQVRCRASVVFFFSPGCSSWPQHGAKCLAGSYIQGVAAPGVAAMLDEEGPQTCTPVFRFLPSPHTHTCSSFFMNQGLSMAGYSHSYSTQRRRPPDSMWRSAASLRAAGGSYIIDGCTAQHDTA